MNKQLPSLLEPSLCPQRDSRRALPISRLVLVCKAVAAAKRQVPQTVEKGGRALVEVPMIGT